MRQRLQRNYLCANDHSQSRNVSNVYFSVHHTICPDLNNDMYKHGNIGHIHTDLNNHVPDISREKDEHQINSSSSENEEAARSILLINNLQRCSLGLEVQILI